MRKKARVFSGYTIRRHAFGALWNALNRWRWVQGRLKFGFWKNLGRSKACTERAGRTGKFPCWRPVPGLEGFCARVPQACLPRVSAAWWGLHAQGPLPVAVPSPERSPRPGNSTPEWQSAVEGRNRVEGRKGGRAGSVGRRGGLTRERQKTPIPPGWVRGAVGEGSPSRARASRTHSPAPPPPRPPGGGSELPRAARAHKARARALPVASSSSRSARSVPAPLIQSRARAPSQPPLPPRSCHGRPLLGKPSPSPSHFALLKGGSRWSPGPHFRTPPRSCLAQ